MALKYTSAAPARYTSAIWKTLAAADLYKTISIALALFAWDGEFVQFCIEAKLYTPGAMKVLKSAVELSDAGRRKIVLLFI